MAGKGALQIETEMLLKRLVKSNRRLTLQDITAKLKSAKKYFQPENRAKGVAFGRI